MASVNSTKILILDDDPDASAFMRSKVVACLPNAQIEVRAVADIDALSVAPSADAQLWACIFDDDFGGVKLAARIAVALHAAQPECQLIAVTGCFSAAKRAVLLALGCQSACDKCDPAQLPRALEALRAQE